MTTDRRRAGRRTKKAGWDDITGTAPSSGDARAPQKYSIAGHFTAVFEQGDGWWIGYVEEMPNVLTQGKSIEEARENLKEAFILVLETARELAEEKFAGRDIVKEEFVVTDR